MTTLSNNPLRDKLQGYINDQSWIDKYKKHEIFDPDRIYRSFIYFIDEHEYKLKADPTIFPLQQRIIEMIYEHIKPSGSKSNKPISWPFNPAEKTGGYIRRRTRRNVSKSKRKCNKCKRIKNKSNRRKQV